ncbi:copper amine oxidase [Streptomyces sp. GC420]|uniref:copper amine oxidase n=1 Tax=Streptomyces sp. GC420 TaxID=2697568 RepID=UPI00141504AE|nr:copper amine oxidase [Streptomyces sp. GC420]NBM18079.1 copper amine oxidase [Streptomyces sp. GC420]
MHVNRVSRARRRGAAALAASALLGGAAVATGPAANAATPEAPAAAAADCSDAYKIEQTLSGGTTWRMCWSYEREAGLVLNKVSYQPKGENAPIKVLTTGKLGQIHVPYDDGQNEYDDLTSFGFGMGLQGLKAAECPGGTIKTVKLPDGGGNVKGLCTTTRARGHAYRMAGDAAGQVWQAQGKDLLVYTVNQVGWYEYMTEWRFSDDGTVNANVGATGSLSYGDYDAGDGRGWPIGKGAKDYATSHSHNVFWRLNFGLDGKPSKVEQYDSKLTAPSGGGTPKIKTTRTKVTKELAGDVKTYRWWRMVSATGKNKDNHARSYEIVPGPSTKYPGRGYTKHDVYFTEYNKCEQFASNNLRSCGAGAGKSVDKWVNGQTLTRPVTWVNIGFHHIARDEDQQPMPVHWQGFQMVPRDVTAMNPLTPDALKNQNGNYMSGR